MMALIPDMEQLNIEVISYMLINRNEHYDIYSLVIMITASRSLPLLLSLNLSLSIYLFLYLSLANCLSMRGASTAHWLYITGL